MHRVIINHIYADAPARGKLCKAMKGVSAWLACQFCWMTAIDGAPHGTGAKLMCGYNQPVTATHGDMKGTQMQMGVNDEARRLSHAGGLP